MPINNNRSRARLVRVPLEYDDYLRQKANGNGGNPHNHIATEINALIEADYLRARRRKAQVKTA